MGTDLAQPGFFSGHLNYSAANEDGRSELAAFGLRGAERVLCIAGGGERPLDLLTGDAAPGEIVVVDANPDQVHLFELKRAALRGLSGPEAFALVGLVNADGAARQRLLLTISNDLPPATRDFFSRRGAGSLRRGALYAGRFERFCALVSLAVRTVMGRAVDDLFEATDMEQQRKYVARAIEGGRWRALLGTLCRPIWFRILLDDPAFHRTGVGDVGAYIRNRIDRALWHVPARDNFLLALLLRGRYLPDRGVVPACYRDGALARVRARLSETTLTTRVESLADVLHDDEPGFDAMSLSDVLSYVETPAARRLFEGVARALRPGGIAVFRELLTAVDFESIAWDLPLVRDLDTERDLAQRDSSFVYRFRVMRRIAA